MVMLNTHASGPSPDASVPQMGMVCPGVVPQHAANGLHQVYQRQEEGIPVERLLSCRGTGTRGSDQTRKSYRESYIYRNS